MHPNEQIWLVKSGDRIIGPFFESALVQKLLSREIVVIDEVARPGGRWSYIREEPTFTKTVEEVWSRSQGLREDTDIATVSSAGELLNGEKTQTVTPFAEGSYNPKGRTVSVKNSTATSSLPPSGTTSFQFERSKKENKNNPSWVWLVVAAAVVLGVFVIFRQPIANEPKPPVNSFGKIAQAALRTYNVGDFAGSLKFLREAHQLRPADPEINLRLANLTLKVDRQTVDAKRLANETLALVHDPEHLARGQTILALVAKADGDFNEAEKILNEVLRANPGFVPATFNLGMINFTQNKLAAAQASFAKALSLDPNLSLARFMWNLSQLKLNQKVESDSGEANSDADSGKLHQEQALLAASLNPSEEGIQNVFSKDPFLTDEYRNDPLLDSEGLNWKSLVPFCEKISSALPKSIKAKALLVVCEVKAGQKAQAAKLVAASLALAPGNTSVLEANGYLLLDFGKEEEAEGSLKLAMRQSTDQISSTLMARACKESQDAICEREQWKRIVEKDANNLPALVNLARLEFDSGNKDEAQSWFEKARPLAADYIPWLQLNEIMGNGRL